MDLETVIQSKSEREKQISYNIAYMWNLEKLYRRTYLQRRNSDTDVENKCMDTKGGKLRWGGDGGLLNWAIGIDMYTVMCINLMTNKNLQYKKTNRGFPGGTVFESPPAGAGDTGSCLGPGRSHMPRSGWAREPWPLGLHVRSTCSTMGEATTVRGPHTAKENKTKQKNKKTPKQTRIPCGISLHHLPGFINSGC